MEKNNNLKVKLKDFANGTSSAVLLILFVVALVQFYCIAGPEDHLGDWRLQIYALASRTNTYSKYIFSLNMTENVLMGLTAIVVAGIQGSFAIRKAKCNTILSHSVKRKEVFNSRIIPSIFGLCLTVIVPKLFAYHANIEADGFSTELLRFCIADFLSLITIGVFAYTVVILCCFITKHWLDALIATGFVLFFGEITKSLVADLLHATLYGGRTVGLMLIDSTNPFDPVQVATSLLTQDVSYEFAKENTVYFLIAGSVLMLVICITALHFIKKHFCTSFKPENIGRLSDNKAVIMFNKISAGLLGASLATSLIYQYFDPFFNNTVIIIMAAGGLICGCLLTMFYNLLTAERFHFNKKDLIPLATACSAIALCLVFGLTNFFGLYDKVPEADEVESVTISVPFDGFVPTPDMSTGFTTADVFNTLELELTHKESIETATTIHSTAVSDKTPQFAGNIHLTYQLKNGTKLERQYSHISEKAYNSALALWDTPEVKEFYKNVLFPTDEMLEDSAKGAVSTGYIGDNSEIVLVSKSQSKELLTEITPEDHKKIRTAIHKDICSLSYKDYFMPESPQLGAIQISYEASFYSFFRDFNFYITDKCTNTIKVLEELNLLDKLSTPRPIKSVYCIDTAKFLEKYLPMANAVHFNLCNSKEFEKIHIPQYDIEHNNYFLSFDFTPYNVKDSSQWQTLNDKSYHAYYIKNDGKILMVDYVDGGKQIYVIPE